MTEWIFMSEAIALLQRRFTLQQSKILLLERLHRNLMYSRPVRKVVREDTYTDFRQSRHIKGQPLNEIILNHGWVDDDEDISPYFWSKDFAESDGSWIGRAFAFHCEYYANWHQSEFLRGELGWETQPDGTETLGPDGEAIEQMRVIHLIGVQVEKPLVELLLGSNGDDIENEAALNWAYDWLGAFAHVAARCRFDAVLEDIEKRGAKADIVDMLKDWFGANQPKMPGDTVLKEKADIILKELKKQFGRSPPA